MKKIRSLLTASAVTLSLLLSSGLYFNGTMASAADQVRIMPIGDSITFGLGEDGGYRKYLDYSLRARNIEFDMVGPEGKNSDSFKYNGQNVQYDGNHAGYSGYTIKQQYPVPSWGKNGLLEKLQEKNAVKQAAPDIVLLIIGTNDMTANRNLSDCEKELHTLIDYILANMPEGGVIFIGSIPEFTAYGGNAQRVANYNSTVKKVAESYGENVQFADVHGSLNGMADMSSDKLHPSGAGYEKMGKFWAGVIDEYLASGNEPDDPENPEILTSDFEDGLSGWQARGSSAVSAVNSDAASGNGSASVTGRTASWNGITCSLSSRKCPAGTRISVQAKVKHNADKPVHFKMTMQYDKNGTAVYDTFAEKDIPSGKWSSLICSDYEIKEGTGLSLYFETEEELCDFYLDDVIVRKSDGTVIEDPDVQDPEPQEPEIQDPEPQEPEPQKPVRDVDGNGVLDAADLTVLIKYFFGADAADFSGTENADINEDGILNIADLCMLKNLLVNPEQL